MAGSPLRSEISAVDRRKARVGQRTDRFSALDPAPVLEATVARDSVAQMTGFTSSGLLENMLKVPRERIPARPQGGITR